MRNREQGLRAFCFCLLFIALISPARGQNTLFKNTHIGGFVDLLSSYQDGKTSFGFGEQDLFITSELHDRFSFLGESVFKFTPTTPTEFSVSIERVIVKYNYYGNHNLLLGKHHTPINYWNDTYHHGRLFFPTIDRPLLFAANFIPLHTVGISAQGHDLGGIRFGYDLMVGNGLGSEDVQDNDVRKSVTAAVHIKPADGLRIGFSYYNDQIAPGADVHGKIINWQVNQQMFTGSLAYFGRKFELLAESTMSNDKTDTTGTQTNWASYVYAGFRITDKLVPYIRYDDLRYGDGEIYYTKDNTTSIVAGMRYHINYVVVVKLEYQHMDAQVEGKQDKFTFQVAIGF
ncbi:MAG: hypothetical protein ACHQET_14220 [Chitinophagales bacterium]